MPENNTNSAKPRVLVADDEPAARRGVAQLLSAFPEFAIVGDCRNGGEVLRSLDSLRPDVVFLDVQMPGLDGLTYRPGRSRQTSPRPTTGDTAPWRMAA